MSAADVVVRKVLEDVLRFSDSAIQALDPDELNASDQKRLTVFVYLFGAVNGAAQQESLLPPQVHAVTITFFQHVFEMSPIESARVSQWCIDQTDAQSLWKSSIHAGMDAFLRWKGGMLLDPASDLVARIRSVGTRSPR